MKHIGIKLADGSFYPILEEGEKAKRILDLTTAQDNQDEVHVDLYSFEMNDDGTTSDEEYMDTITVPNLKPHTKGEPNLQLSIGIDENNELSAEILDSETGSKSEKQVNLAQRKPAEKSEIDAAELTDQLTNSEMTINNLGIEEPKIDDSIIEDPSFEEASLDDIGESNGIVADNEAGDDLNLPENDDSLSNDDFSLPDVDDNTANNEAGDDLTIPETDDSLSNDDFNLPDMDEGNGITADSGAGNDFDVPDFDGNGKTDEPESQDFSMPDFDDAKENSGSGLFDFPDFDNMDGNGKSDEETTFSQSGSSSSEATMDDPFSDIGFSDLYDKNGQDSAQGESDDDFDDDEGHSKAPLIICIIIFIICLLLTLFLLFIFPSKYNILGRQSEKNVTNVTNTTNTTNITNISGENDSKNAESEAAKQEAAEPAQKYVQAAEKNVPEQKTDFDEPSDKKQDDGAIGAEDEDKIIIESDASKVVPSEKTAPQAQEDKIVIAPDASKVVPVSKPELTIKKEDIKHHVKWGDTLWDISETYYKNPWRYPRIASHNNIRNPDLIYSGSNIMIPYE